MMFKFIYPFKLSFIRSNNMRWGTLWRFLSERNHIFTIYALHKHIDFSADP